MLQIKICGQRVDIAEVERDLANIAGVAEFAVVAAPQPNGESCLVAYIVPIPGLTPSAPRLRTAARAIMPRYPFPRFCLCRRLAAVGKWQDRPRCAA